MKLSIIEREGVKREIVIYCEKIDDEIRAIASSFKRRTVRMTVKTKHNETLFLEPSHILYCESVNRETFVYTKNDVYSTSQTLHELEVMLQGFDFLRCAKSTLLNISTISSLQSELGGRIVATLSNQEKIIISRHYAKSLRALLV